MGGRSLNKVQLIGHLGQNAELKYTANGANVANFSLATNERFKDGDEWKDRTEWHRIVKWNAEGVNEYLTKGAQVYIEGRLQTRSWEDRDGQKRYTTEVIASDLILLGGRGGSGSVPMHTGVPPKPTSGEDAEAAGVLDDAPF